VISEFLLSAIDVLADPPDPAPEAPPGMKGPTDLFISWLKWGGIVAGVIGICVSGIMMMVGRRNRSSMAADGASGLPWVIGGLALVAGAAGVVGVILK